MRYVDAAMIVTDLAGFTQWTASCAHDPSIVIALLTKMFLNIDRIMPLYKVEKIATVGDAFIGVIFNDCLTEPVKLGMRASHAIQFGCDILNTASSTATGSQHSLKMRVGVHVGTFVGGFVGTSPPKFDCFGPDFERAKLMESSGRPGYVHASKATVASSMRWEKSEPFAECPDDQLVEEFAATTTSNSITSRGVLCRKWDIHLSVGDVEGLDSGDSIQFLVAASANSLPLSPNHSDEQSVTNDRINQNAMEICERLVRFSRQQRAMEDVGGASHSVDFVGDSTGLGVESRGVDITTVVSPTANLFSQDDHDDVADEMVRMVNGEGLSRMATTMTTPHVAENTLLDGACPHDATVNNAAIFEFSYWRLVFMDPTMEDLYTRHVLSNGILTETYKVLALNQMLLLVTHALNGCNDTLGNRLVLSGCMALTALWVGLVMRYRVDNRGAVAFIALCACATFILSAFQSTECNTRGIVNNVSNIISCYYISASVILHFALNKALMVRVAFHLTLCVLGIALTAARLQVFGDDGAIGWNENVVVFPAAVPVLFGASYFLDFSQRSSFAATLRLSALLSSSRGKHALTASQAIDIMLPPFVCAPLIERLTTMPHQGQLLPTTDTNPLAGLTERPSSPSVPGVDLQLLTNGMIWEYSSVVVMFIEFKPVPPALRRQMELENSFSGSHSTLRSHSSRILAGGNPVRSNSVDLRPHISIDEDMLGPTATLPTPTGSNSTAKIRSETFDDINNIMMRLEKVIAKHQVQKVKSIGNTLLAVAGIDDFCFEPFKKTFRAALEAKDLLEHRSRFSIGISSGACFGAVIGVKGLCFDIFGDTVNTASRMCTTAAEGTIQLSEMARMAAISGNQLPSNLSLDRVPDPIVVKGKGAMNVYQLNVSSSEGGQSVDPLATSLLQAAMERSGASDSSSSAPLSM